MPAIQGTGEAESRGGCSLGASLHTGIESAVKCGGGLSRFFPVTSGMKQGCALAPTLFNTCMDWIMGRATIQSHCGATLGNIKVADLDIADDVAILSEFLESLVVALDAFTGVMNSLDKSIWRCRYLCRRNKLGVFKALIVPVLLYGSETWTLSCALELYGHLARFPQDDAAHQVVSF
ncbi:uncharacterized protein [Penaeus vannamei]|uniref:uncharacterized protein n=1 Tax=Penaeus vannamei TaxID=6689 RepID=UPI00387F7F0F